jgi:hypothetical protein
MNDTDRITRQVTVPVPPDHAWSGFVDDFALWWPREHCFVGEAGLDRVFIDPAGAVWGEVARDGRVLPWGAVRDLRPGAGLTLGWQMDATVSPWVPDPDPTRASWIDVAFDPVPGGTRVTLTHRDLARHGDGGAMAAVMVGLDRWADWLADYARHLTPAPCPPFPRPRGFFRCRTRPARSH